MISVESQRFMEPSAFWPLEHSRSSMGHPGAKLKAEKKGRTLMADGKWNFTP